MEILRKHFKSIESTNTWAKEHVEELDQTKVTLISAEAQTAGRGRFNRRWESPAQHNMYASFCFFVEKERQDIGNIPQLLAISLTEILKDFSIKAHLKWPNDIVKGGKKLAGILCETTSLGEKKGVIVGIGVNVNMPTEELQKIDQPATSLYVETGRLVAPEEILERLHQHFLPALLFFLEKGFFPFFEKYTHLLIHKEASALYFHDNRVKWKGRFHSIHSDGSLNLTLDSGEIKNFNAGEIIEE